MLKQIEGSRAIAETVALCRPEVICAYPITPQTHIVEGLGEIVARGDLPKCAFINVESEFAALSVAIGASAAGARAYTATSSQGLLYMAEAVYNAAGLGLPIVMTLGTRAIGAPINIWNDHSDAMALRDAGWIQLFAESNQEAVDLHVLAFRLAEELSLPVMVCVDGFILTHAFERIDVPSQEDVDAVLPPLRAGAGARPVRAHHHRRPGRTRGVHRGEGPSRTASCCAPSRSSPPWRRRSGSASVARRAGSSTRTGPTTPTRSSSRWGPSTARSQEVVDAMRAEGQAVGSLDRLHVPAVPVRRREGGDAVGEAGRRPREERVGRHGRGPGERRARGARTRAGSQVHAVIAGLGGRPIPRAAVRRVVEAARRGTLGAMCFLDLDEPVVERALAEGAAR